MRFYKVLNNQVFNLGVFSIVPIREKDRFDIMNWRNEQIYHLRQDKPLDIESQNNYFKNVISTLFIENEPNQILFSFLKNDKCIGYGGLVHINWVDKNSEISFIMDTKLEKQSFQIYWNTFLSLIEKIGFEELKMHKLYVYAFDLRPHLYNVLEKSNYFKDAVLNQHCLFKNKYLDVVIYSKINSKN